MKDLVARHFRGINAVNLGILDGWYATSPADEICSGPFSTEADCRTHIRRERTDIDAYHQGAKNKH